jgi:hypothetical protein
MTLSHNHRDLVAEKMEGFNQRETKTFFYGKGFYAFLFETKEDGDFFFLNGPCFFVS